MAWFGSFSQVDAQLLPFIFVSLSAFLLVLGHLHIRIFQRRIKESLTPGTTPASSNLTILRAHIRQYGGKRVYGLIFMRALGLALLAVMSANGRTKQCFRLEAICSTSVAMAYSSILTMVSLYSRLWYRALTRHVMAISWVSIGVCAYYFMWPPAHMLSVGHDLWEIGILFSVCGVSPLLVHTMGRPPIPSSKHKRN